MNRIVHCDPPHPRRILTLVDGIVAGEGEGSLRPIPKAAPRRAAVQERGKR